MHFFKHQSPEPSLPQSASPEEKKQRAFDLSLAKTSYNYMFSYLEPIPISADLPKGEEFTPDYELMVLEVFVPLAKNFEHMLIKLMEREIASDLPIDALTAIKKVDTAYERLKDDFASHNPLKMIKSIDDIKELLEALAHVPKELEKALHELSNMPKDLMRLVQGLKKVFAEFEEEGFTAFLKNTFYETLCTESGRNYLLAKDMQDYKDVIADLSVPYNLRIEKQAWMNDCPQSEIYQQDWYFAYLQTAGFNTTILKAVLNTVEDAVDAHLLSDFLDKMPITDATLQSVTGDASITMQKAAEKGLLYACDYSMFADIPGSELHDMQRYPVAPIALFYWNHTPPTGYPPEGALQPIAIQLNQQHDAETAPIFTPNDCTHNHDNNGVKWQIAKTTVLNTSAIQHEAVAHLGACHLTIEPIVVATHRQLPVEHPVMILLKPHFRFTLEINNGAIHSLIVPGGVVASVLSSSIEGSGKLIVDAHAQWRFDQHKPDVLFKRRGVSADLLPQFPFRDDTLDLWDAMKSYVSDYLELYYQGDNNKERDLAIQSDYELQQWINELVNPKYAAVKGLDKLVKTNNPDQPYAIESFDYLVDIIALIIYTASAQHAGVNYAQFPLMSFIPSVSGTLYHQPPTKSDDLTPEDILQWLPPLDVALYQASFGYLLSGVQYDRLGYYSSNPRFTYFKDTRVTPILANFQLKLKQIEVDIHSKNKHRPFPYLLQLPSIIPNSISI